MNQVLHIFQKDIRHYWREAAVSIALAATYGWSEVRGSGLGPGALAATGLGGIFTSGFLSGAIVVLLPVAWILLIVRIVQGEALVGDRQFWLTRPYEWKKLLAAKALFVLASINLPLLILDIFLLAKAGFAPSHYLLGLLWLQLQIVLFLVLPAMALATITNSVWKFVIAVLLIALYMIGMAALAQEVPSSSFSPSFADTLQAYLLIGTCVAVVLLQYARRKTGLSRWLILGFAGIVFLILVATPYQTVVAHNYPQLRAGQTPPVQLSLLPPTKAAVFGRENNEDKKVEIRIPLGVSGIADDTIVNVNGVMVMIESPDGTRWNSGWKSQGMILYQEHKSTEVSFELKKSLFDRMKSSPVKARISLALSVFRDGHKRRFVTPDGEFRMPDVGLCIALSGYSRTIQCLAPLRSPSLLVTTDLSENTCPVGEGESRGNVGEIARDWKQNFDSAPAEFGISSVREVEFYIWSAPGSSTRPRTTAGICPGTPLTLSNPDFVQSMRTEVEIDALRLNDYKVNNRSFAFGGIAIK